MAGCAPVAAQTFVDADDIPPDHRQQIAKAIGNDLRDPLSAQYRNVKRSSRNLKTGAIVYCGEVNAKNAYGGYVGFTPFYADISDGKGGVLPSPKHYAYKLLVLAINGMCGPDGGAAQRP